MKILSIGWKAKVGKKRYGITIDTKDKLNKKVIEDYVPMLCLNMQETLKKITNEK